MFRSAWRPTWTRARRLHPLRAVVPEVHSATQARSAVARFAVVRNQCDKYLRAVAAPRACEDVPSPPMIILFPVPAIDLPSHPQTGSATTH